MSAGTAVGADGDQPEGAYQQRIRIAEEIVVSGLIPPQPDRLTRRKRHLVVAADQWQDHATVWFIRRGHGGEPVDETVRFERVSGEWTYTGGGGGSPGADLENRLSLSELRDHPSQRYHHTNAAEQIPFGFSSGASYSRDRASLSFQTVSEAATLTFSDRDARSIATHGHCLVEYDPRRSPTITALDVAGNDLGSFTPARRPDRRFKGFKWRFRRRHGVHPADRNNPS